MTQTSENNLQSLWGRGMQHNASTWVMVRLQYSSGSENLSDLADLKQHVINSRNFVLLLTPGVLMRPWFLTEIVTALNHGVNLVPVEMQRPGLNFYHPDEEYYRSVRGSDLFTSIEQKLLTADIRRY